MQKIGLALTVIVLLIILGLRPSPRGWTEQGSGSGAPTATPTTEG